MEINHAPWKKAFYPRNPRHWLPYLIRYREGDFLWQRLKGKGTCSCSTWQYFICGFMRSTYNGVRNTGKGYMGLNTGFVKAGTHFALPLNLAANLATGGWTWLRSRQDLRAKTIVQSRLHQGVQWLYCRSALKCHLKKICIPVYLTQTNCQMRFIVCAFVLLFVSEHCVYSMCYSPEA